MEVLGILVDVESEMPLVSLKKIDESLDSLYNILNCGTIDIVARKIGGKYFDIVCDDEGLFKEHPKVSAIDKNNQPMLVGNLFICNHDSNGHLASLSENDIDMISVSFSAIYQNEEVRSVLVADY